MLSDYFVHDIDPIFINIGPIRIAWYGISFALSFLIGYFLLKKNLDKKGVVITTDHYFEFIFAIIIGVMIGARVGYILFYQLSHYIQNPWHMFAIWQGGLSFHGGLIGVVVSCLIFCKRFKYDFYTIADPAMPIAAIGVGLVRMANFINGELYGKVTDLPWAVIFYRTDPYLLPRHPSQIYEAFLEGFFMAILLQILLFKLNIKGMIFWAFISIYGVVRFLIEFIRLPDDLPIYGSGWLFGSLSMGQILSLGMVLCAMIFIYRLKKR